MKRIKAIVGLLLLMAGQAVAQEEHLVMHFDFENVDGKNVTDPVSGITAKVMNQASVVEMGSRRVLDLGNRLRVLPCQRECLALRRRLFPVVLLTVRCQHCGCLSIYGISPERPAYGHIHRWLQP